MKILVGLSGGVDSAATVLLLKQKGYEVTALYFDVTKEGNEQGFENAKAAAKKLEIPLIYKNKAEDFEKIIIAYFCEEYQKGRTPSPCVKCNPLFKLKILKDAADELGIPFIATGHYAKISEEDGIFYVEKAKNQTKDQSYMLCRVPQEILKKLILPLSQIETKEEVRKIASDFGLSNAKEKDSQDLCFMSGDYKDFLREKNVKSKEGIIEYHGKFLQNHGGIANFTIGQRKGLGVAVGKPIFVSSIDAKTGTVSMGDNEELFKNEVKLKELIFTKPLEQELLDFEVKLRYTAKPELARLEKDTLYFEIPQRAPTPGQFAVLYKNDRIMGSGIIV